MDVKEIYELKAMETATERGLIVRRVPGGWIFEIVSNTEGDKWMCVFVPFSDEFDK